MKLDTLKNQGIRVCYINYGFECTSTLALSCRSINHCNGRVKFEFDDKSLNLKNHSELQDKRMDQHLFPRISS